MGMGNLTIRTENWIAQQKMRARKRKALLKKTEDLSGDQLQVQLDCVRGSAVPASKSWTPRDVLQLVFSEKMNFLPALQGTVVGLLNVTEKQSKSHWGLRRGP
jgi:hypothetical protein